MKDNKWARLLAYVTGMVSQRLLLQCEYLAAENRILRSQLPKRLRLSNPQRATLAEIGKRLGRKCLVEVACVAKPDTILSWYRRLVAQKFDGSKRRSYPGRPKLSTELEQLVVRVAKENPGWGYDRIAGALANLGHHQTIGNVLKRHGVAPAPKRSRQTTWKNFIAAHMAVLAGTDFFTVEVLTWRGLATYYILFFLHLETRRVTIVGLTWHPTEEWMGQMARNATDDGSGCFQVYEALESGNYAWESWQILAPVLPYIGFWREWDRCEKLRRAVRDRFASDFDALLSSLQRVASRPAHDEIIRELKSGFGATTGIDDRLL